MDDLIAEVTGTGYVGSATAFELDSSEAISPTSGWLIVHELGVPALKEIRELASVFVHDGGQVDTELGRRLLARAGSFPNDRALAPADVPADQLDSALAAAEAAGYARLGDLEDSARAESGRQLDRERAKIVGLL